MPAGDVSYAGLYVRTMAILIDFAILAVFTYLLLMGSYVIDAEAAALEQFAWEATFGWPYFSFAESSRWQGTPGKRLLGLRVTDLAGARISFGRASLRYLVKVFSLVIWIVSLFTVVTTPRKQALHDGVAGTAVLRDTDT